MRRLFIVMILALLAVRAQAAITVTSRGQNGDGSTATTFTVTPSGNFAAGSWAVLVIASDNAAGTGGVQTTYTVTDSIGNTWTKQQHSVYDPSTALAGVEGAIWTTSQDVGTLTTGTTITVTFGTASPMEAWNLMEVVPTGGTTLSYVTGAMGAGSATGTPTITTGAITSGNVVVGCTFNERGGNQVVTGDSDTSDGTWSTQQTFGVDTGGSGVTCQSQRKVVTGTNTQTFNPTMTSSDVFLGWIEMTETAGGGGAPRQNSLLAAKRRRG